MRSLKIFAPALFGLAVLATSLHAQELRCPERRDKMEVQVSSSVTFEPATGFYVYSYIIASKPSSQQEVSNFALDVSGDVREIASPRGWSHGTFRSRPTIHWAATEVELPPDWVDDGGIPPGAYQIKPGTSLSGFSFKSAKPPGQVAYYLRGYAPMAAASSEEEAELILDECPPETVGTFFDMALRGMTLGPADIVPIEVRVKPGFSPNHINPRSEGVIPVAVRTTDTFDAATIDPLSVRFGRGEAMEAHNTGHLEDINGDGRPDLVLHFDTAASGIQCGDIEVKLTGRTYGGQTVEGSDAIVTVGCPKNQ
jgi:hypothetical protein